MSIHGQEDPYLDWCADQGLDPNDLTTQQDWWEYLRETDPFRPDKKED